MQKPILSILIPVRNEFPNVVHTCYSIMNSLETDGFKPKDYEIILLNNCSDDRGEIFCQECGKADSLLRDGWEQDMVRRGTGGSIDYLRTRGAYWNRVIKTMYYPLAGNHTVRNRGAEIARGKYIFMSDAHMAYCPGYFKEFIRAVDESGGMVHGVLDWMGAYPPTAGGVGYTIKLGEEIKGTWNNYRLTDRNGKLVKDWWYVPALGHCSLGCLKDQFLDFGGYQEHHRCYGGGEFYLNMKWWMFGSNCVVNPKMIGYHLAAGRGYSYNHDDYIYNVFQIGYALGADWWVERMYINQLRKGRKEILDSYLEQAWKAAQHDRKLVESRRKMTFNELIVERPWQKKNIEKYGNGLPQLQIVHDTWLDLLKEAPDYCQKAYNESKYQKELEEFINNNLNEFVYKRKR